MCWYHIIILIKTFLQLVYSALYDVIMVIPVCSRIKITKQPCFEVSLQEVIDPSWQIHVFSRCIKIRWICFGNAGKYIQVSKTKHEQTCGQKPIELAYSNCVDNVGWQQASRFWLQFTADDFHHMTIWFTTRSGSSLEKHAGALIQSFRLGGPAGLAILSIHGNSVRSKNLRATWE